MRLILATFLLFAIAIPCQAQGEKPKPNTLTPKEIADGWLLLFDGETTFGWKCHPDALKVGEGVWHVDATALFPTNFLSFDLRFEYKADAHTGFASYLHKRNGALVNDGRALPKQAEWKPAAMKVEGGKLWWELEGKEKLEYDCTDSGSIIFSAPGAASAVKLKLRNIKLRPLNMTPLYDGKNLAAWKEFPGKKSKFTLADGAITVKDGPGDLQTLGKYQNFVLQLECISNGKHLNSGIFFRCKDNEYQNGYEAQIFNKFTKEPTQDYTVEEYDPKTNKLLAKNKVKSTAVDFGTGAIYRRVPARKEMSKDGEWFGMTIVAHGNHIATWVNGVQVTDWTDNRPKSDNPRTGCRLEAGHISIQGHDPTTNLSFRNFRIAELPTGK
jgi:hypothetical protein